MTKFHFKMDDDKRWMIIIIAFILASFSFLLDDSVFSLVRLSESTVADYFMIFLSSQIVIALFFIFASIMLFRKNRSFPQLFTTLLTTGIIVTALKLIIARARPEELVLFLFGLPDYSFPSMHTALMFSTVYLLGKNFKKARFLFLVAACLVGLSRIYLGVHHFSDVLFGALIGFLTGYFVYKLDEHGLPKITRKVYKKKK